MDAFGFDPWNTYEPPAEIVPGLWLGCEEAARRRKDEEGLAIICVHEDPRWHHAGYHVPVADLKWVDRGAGMTRDVDTVSRDMLNAVTSIARHHIKKGDAVLIHCAAGMERSPLAVAWYLKRFQHVNSIPHAYKLLKMKRPIVEDRSNWLNHARDRK